MSKSRTTDVTDEVSTWDTVVFIGTEVSFEDNTTHLLTSLLVLLILSGWIGYTLGVTPPLDQRVQDSTFFQNMFVYVHANISQPMTEAMVERSTRATSDTRGTTREHGRL